MTAVLVPVTIADDYWRAAPDDIAALAATASGAAPSTVPSIGSPPTVDSTIVSRPVSTVVASAHDGEPVAIDPGGDDPPGDDRAVGRGDAGAAPGRCACSLVGDSTAEVTRCGARRVGRRSSDPRRRSPRGVARVRVRTGRRGRRPTATCRSPNAATTSSTTSCPTRWSSSVPRWSCCCARARDLRRSEWSDDEGTIDPFDARVSKQRINHDYARIAELVTASGATAIFVRGPLDRSVLARSGDDVGLRRTTCRRRRRDAATGDGRRTGCGSSTCGRGSEANGLAASHDARPDGMHWTPRGRVRPDRSVARPGIAVDRPPVMNDHGMTGHGTNDELAELHRARRRDP